MREILKSGSARGVKLFYKAEYCDTLQSKEKRNRENKACLNDRALRLLDHNISRKVGSFPAPERGDFSKNTGILQLKKTEPF
jgi:hypothetical protein